MKVKSSSFIIGVANPVQLPKSDFLEIAFAGRSNAGKSSLINKLCNRNNLARESASPGKTRQLNFYNINDEIFFVDLPGYGYASVSEKENTLFNKTTDLYLNKREQLYLIILVLDIRHKPTVQDIMMINWLNSTGINYIVAASKTDKIPRGDIKKQVELIRSCGIPEETAVIPISSESGWGIPELWEKIDSFIIED